MQQMATTMDSNESDVVTEIGELPAFDDIMGKIRTLNVYIEPVIFGLGLASNAFGIAMLATGVIRKSACSVYFLAIIVANEIYLLIFTHSWLSLEMGFSLFDVIGGWCQFTTFASKASEFLSLWYPVCLTFDRCVHLIRPEAYSAMFSVWRSRLLVIALTVISIMIFLNTSLTFGVKYAYPPLPLPRIPYCSALDMFKTTSANLLRADVIFNGILGHGCIIALLGRIVYEKSHSIRSSLHDFLRRRYTETGVEGTEGGDEEPTNASTGDVFKGQTVASVVYAVIFAACNIPLQGYRTRNMIKVFLHPSEPPQIWSHLINEVLVLLKLISFSSTLYILLIFHPGFRHHVHQLSHVICSKYLKPRDCDIELSAPEAIIESRLSKSSVEESSTVEFVSHESAYV